MKNLFKKVFILQKATESVLAELKEIFTGKTDFEFFICMDSDGQLMITDNNLNYVPVLHCLKILESKGFLSLENFLIQEKLHS